MKEIRLHLWIGVACCLLLAAGACTSTSLTVLQPGEAADGVFRKIAVMGCFNSPEDRKNFEDGIVTALQKKGCDAVSSIAFMKHGEKHSEKEMEKLFTRQGLDAILILKVAGLQEERTDIPETYYYPMEPYVYSWFPYWTDGLGMPIRGGYHEKHDVVKMDSALFSLKTHKRVWEAQSETKRVQSIAKLASSLGPSVAKKLEKEKLIP